MADRLQFYFGQLVTAEDVNLAFDQVERSLHALATDVGVFGLVTGFELAPAQPLPSLSLQVTAPGLGYDARGRRVTSLATETVDCAVDAEGRPTSVPQGQERWVGVFVRFVRRAHDSRLDQNSAPVLFRQDEAAEVLVRAADAAPVGQASRVALDREALLLGEVLLQAGQDTIEAADVDTTRRQRFVLTDAQRIGLAPMASPQVVQPQGSGASTVQTAVQQLDEAVGLHASGFQRRHDAMHIDARAIGFLRAGSLDSVLAELISRLSSRALPTPGGARIGQGVIRAGDLDIAAGTVDSQLRALAEAIVAHARGTEHDARYMRRLQSQVRELAPGAQLVLTSDVSPKLIQAGIEDGGRFYYSHPSIDGDIESYVQTLQAGVQWRVVAVNRTAITRRVFVHVYG